MMCLCVSIETAALCGLRNARDVENGPLENSNLPVAFACDIKFLRLRFRVFLGCRLVTLVVVVKNRRIALAFIASFCFCIRMSSTYYVFLFCLLLFLCYIIGFQLDI